METRELDGSLRSPQAWLTLLQVRWLACAGVLSFRMDRSMGGSSCLDLLLPAQHM